MKFDSICLVINPRAGKGYTENAKAARNAVDALRPSVVYTGPGELGEDALKQVNSVKVNILPVPPESGRIQTQVLARQFCGISASAIVVVGGDGTLADVAQTQINQKCKTPLLGIGIGSTNAGNLISCRITDLEQLDCDHLKVEPIKALLAYEGDNLLGIGFNDCVLGYTIVGTIDGQVCDLDAAERMEGRLSIGTPRSIGSAQSLVLRSGPEGEQIVARGKKIATVIIGFAEKAFFAKAIAGGVCLASLVQAPAGCLTADTPLVKIGLDQGTLMAMPPISSTFIPFEESQRIVVSGMHRGTVLCVDGNPLKMMEPADTIEFGVITDAVNSLKLIY